MKKLVELYQCPGCVCGSDYSCFEKGDSSACSKHAAGTTIYPSVGRIFLGMPTGFNRIGQCSDMKINIFEKFSDGWDYDQFNIPVWKHLDENGNTIVRGISPRINAPFLHVYSGNCLSEISCKLITSDYIGCMD